MYLKNAVEILKSPLFLFPDKEVQISAQKQHATHFRYPIVYIYIIVEENVARPDQYCTYPRISKQTFGDGYGCVSICFRQNN